MRTWCWRMMWTVVAAWTCAIARSQTPIPEPPRALESDMHHTLWEHVRQVPAPGGGGWISETNRYEQIEDCLNYLDEKGYWQPSSDQIELVPGGAVLRRVPFRAVFPADCTDAGGFLLLTPEGLELKSRPFGLALYSSRTKESVLIAEAKSAIGELLPNGTQILYPEAFEGEGIKASLRVSVTKHSYESDVVLETQLPDPQAYGLPEDCSLLVLTEFFEAPVPLEHQARTNWLASVWNLATNVTDLAELPDPQLTFGSMRFREGRAFAFGSKENTIPVTKSWRRLEEANPPDKGASQRQFLIEAVDLRTLKPYLESLPPTGKPTAQRPFRKLKHYVQNSLPVPSATRPERTAVGSVGSVGAAALPQLRLARTAWSKQGVVIDYAADLVSTTNKVLARDVTYYVSGQCTLSGFTVLEPTVIKFAPTNSAQLRIQGTLQCRTGPWDMAILTARDDDTVGNLVEGSSGTPSGFYADTALVIVNAPSEVKHLCIRYATRGIQYESGSGWPHYLSHVQMVDCEKGVISLSPAFWVRNALFANVRTNFHTTTSGVAGYVEHITADGGVVWNSATNLLTLNATNCLVAGMSNTPTLGGAGNAALTSSAGVFTTAGAGAHYLAAWSEHRDAGTTNISTQLKADFYDMTTCAPLVLSNAAVTADTIWAPLVLRDTDTPDRGYHYPALDRLLTGVTLQNATLLLTNGVAVAVGGTNGITIQTGGKVISEGRPETLNRLVRVPSVQEQALAWGGNPSTMSLLNLTNSPGGSPEVRLRFTGVSVPAGTESRRYLVDTAADHVLSTLAVSDCELRGVQLTMHPTNTWVTVALTNNYCERVSFHFTQGLYSPVPFTLQLRNNLLWQGALSLSYYSTNIIWTVTDNAFDNVSLVTNGTYDVSNANNGYINTTALSGGSSNVVLSAFTYASGPLGDRYQASSDFYGKGSRTPAAAGLFHHTARLDQTKEATSAAVDIGFHYVAVTPAEVEISTNLMAMDSSQICCNWVANYAKDRLLTNPGWHNNSYTGTDEYLRVDLTNSYTLSRAAYIGRVMSTNSLQDGTRNGVYRQYEIHVNSSGGAPPTWGTPVASGEWTWPNLQERRDVPFEPVTGQYVYFRRITAYGWGSSEDPNCSWTNCFGYANANEVWLYQRNALRSVALDTDGDGLADYFEDRNGNGSADSGETNWQVSENGTTGSAGLQVYTPME